MKTISNYSPINRQLSLEFDTPREHFIGIGSAGYKALLNFYHRGQRGFYTLVGLTRPAHLPEGILFVQVNAEAAFNRGIASGLHTSLLGSANPELRKLDSLVCENQRYTLLLGAGGFNSSIIGTYLAKNLSHRGMKVNTILQTPFSFEGPKKKAIAERTYRTISGYCPTSMLSLDDIRQSHAHLPVSKAMAEADIMFYKSYLNTRIQQAA